MLAHMVRWKTENATPFYYIMRTRLGHTCRPLDSCSFDIQLTLRGFLCRMLGKCVSLLWTLHCEKVRKGWNIFLNIKPGLLQSNVMNLYITEFLLLHFYTYLVVNKINIEHFTTTTWFFASHKKFSKSRTRFPLE